MPTPAAALYEITLKQVRVNKRQFPAHIFLENFWIFAMNQKIENVLALALQTPEPVREKSLNLNVGFTEETRTWELIVKYNGALKEAVSGLPVYQTKRYGNRRGRGVHSFSQTGRFAVRLFSYAGSHKRNPEGLYQLMSCI